MRIVRSILLFIALAAPIVSSPVAMAADERSAHTSHDSSANSALVQKVRLATDGFRDIRNAPNGGYEPILGCVSGPQEGAMGVHYLNVQFLKDGVLDADRPEALIYEFKDGVARLVGVEYIMLASIWQQTHAPEDVPVLEGQLLQYYDSPNRFGLPAFYELHVWAWRDNPHGTFVDWNPRVSCDGQ